jgi:hypothetical protein
VSPSGQPGASPGRPAVEFLFSLERFGMKFGLANIATLCAALGVSMAGLPRIRLTFDEQDWVRIRWATALTATLLWAYLIADGR